MPLSVMTVIILSLSQALWCRVVSSSTAFGKPLLSEDLVLCWIYHNIHYFLKHSVCLNSILILWNHALVCKVELEQLLDHSVFQSEWLPLRNWLFSVMHYWHSLGFCPWLIFWKLPKQYLRTEQSFSFLTSLWHSYFKAVMQLLSTFLYMWIYVKFPKLNMP